MPLSDNMRGALTMTGAMTAFTINDSFMKSVGDALPLFQILFLRGIVATLFLVMLSAALGQLRGKVAARDWRLMAWRAVAEMVGAWSFVTALFNMPLADLSAILQSLPLTITLASALFLGEVVGWRRMAAILVGFAGVLLIVRPGGEGFTVYGGLALVCVAAVTVRDMVSRMMAPGVSSLLVATTSSFGVMVFAGVGSAFTTWAPVDGHAALMLTGSVVFLIGGYILSVSSVRHGDIAFVAPFRYSSLLVAIVLGVIVFDTFPDRWTLIGAAIVVATGLYTLYRERLRLRRAAELPALHASDKGSSETEHIADDHRKA